MAPRLILHIGRHKTGTSSLQHALHAQGDWLAERGILYPRVGRAGKVAHHQVAIACNRNLSDGRELPTIIAGLTTEIAAAAASGCDQVLLSSEGFQNLPDTDRLRTVIEAIGPGEVQVLCYVREHLDYALSAYRQMVQNQTRFLPFHKFAYSLRDMTSFLDRWRSVGDLSLHWFDRAQLAGGDIIADVCQRLGVPPGLSAPQDMNPSIGGNLLAFKLAANRLDEPSPGYQAMRRMALDHAPFRAAFRVDDDAAAVLRRDSAYNASLFVALSETKMKSWSHCPLIPNADTLTEDLRRILPDAAAGRLRRLERVITARAADWIDLARPVGGTARSTLHPKET